MTELGKYGLSDDSRVMDWLKSYNGHREFKRHSAASGALYMTEGKKTTQQAQVRMLEAQLRDMEMEIELLKN